MAKINEIEVSGSLYDLEDKKLTNMIQNAHQNGTQLKEPVVGTGYYNDTNNVPVTYSALCHDGTSFKAVGGYFKGPYESSDGVNWSTISSNTGLISVNSLIYANGYYVAVGSHASDHGQYPTTMDIAYSEDCINWELAATSGGRMAVYDIIYLEDKKGVYPEDTLGVYIAVGNNGVIRSSDNTPTGWLIENGLPDISLNSIAYGKGVLVAVGDGGAVYSTDSKNWLNCSGLNYTMNKVIFHKDRFIAVGAGGTVYESTDGATWSMKSALNLSQYTIDSICYGNGLFLLAYHSSSQSVTSRSYMKYSYDCVNWTTISNSGLNSGRIYNIVYADGKFILGGYMQIACISFDQVIKSLPTIIDDLSGEVYTAIPNKFNRIEEKFLLYKVVVLDTTSSTWHATTTYEDYPYEAIIPVTDYIDIYPIWSLHYNNTLPTKEDYDNFSKIGLLNFDVDNMNLLFYASEIPTTIVYILVKGVK